MSESPSVSHNRQTGALSVARAGSWDRTELEPEVEAGASVPVSELVADWCSWRPEPLPARGRHLILGASPVPVSCPGAGLAAGLGILAPLLVDPAGLLLHPGLLLLLGRYG